LILFASPHEDIQERTPNKMEKYVTVTMMSSLILVANAAIDSRKPAPGTFDEIYDAAAESELLKLLEPYDMHESVRCFLFKQEMKSGVDEALKHAAQDLADQDELSYNVGDNPWCLIIAICCIAIHHITNKQQS
jgi:hypothetical protein